MADVTGMLAAAGVPVNALSGSGMSQPSAPNDNNEVEDDSMPASFDPSVREPDLQRYGLTFLMCLRQSMLPIEKPSEMAHLKFFICPSEGGAADEPDPPRDKRKPKGRGKGERTNDKRSGGGDTQGRGRFVPDMGKTELIEGTHRGQWWKVLTEANVIVKEQFSLTSVEVFNVPQGHYVQQAGPGEVFVNGQASGLQRMPVQPRGWATVDASSVGGPKYLEAVSAPYWRVDFKSGSPKGDIVVRSEKSLDSEEVAVLFFDARVEQAGPQEALEDGIVRMPISFPDSANKHKTKTGWVTCDATSQGGPKFFEPWQASGADGDDVGAAAGNWDKNRMWKVVNLESGDSRSLPVVKRVEPYAPGTGRTPPEDIVVRWLQNGDVLEQIGHSKKMRGFMVMPVKFVSPDSKDEGAAAEEGWVTRRLVDKTRDHEGGSWLEEIREEGRVRRKGHRRDAED